MLKWRVKNSKVLRSCYKLYTLSRARYLVCCCGFLLLFHFPGYYIRGQQFMSGISLRQFSPEEWVCCHIFHRQGRVCHQQWRVSTCVQKHDRGLLLFMSSGNRCCGVMKYCQAKVKSSQGQVKKKVKKKERRLDFADCIVTTPHHHPPPTTLNFSNTSRGPRRLNILYSNHRERKTK